MMNMPRSHPWWNCKVLIYPMHGSEGQAWLRFCSTLRGFNWGVNLPKAWPRFYLTSTQVIRNINLPKVCGPRSQAWPMFSLIFTQVTRNINLPKICGPRSQAWPRFYLIFTQVINTTYNVTNKNIAELPFINNSTFAGYLHSRVAVQHFCLDLLGSTHLYQLPRWYGMVLLN